MRKIKSLWLILKSKHYAVLIGDSEQEISWALQAIQQAQDKELENFGKGKS